MFTSTTLPYPSCRTGGSVRPASMGITRYGRPLPSITMAPRLYTASNPTVLSQPRGASFPHRLRFPHGRACHPRAPGPCQLCRRGGLHALYCRDGPRSLSNTLLFAQRSSATFPPRPGLCNRWSRPRVSAGEVGGTGICYRSRGRRRQESRVARGGAHSYLWISGTVENAEATG